LTYIEAWFDALIWLLQLPFSSEFEVLLQLLFLCFLSLLATLATLLSAANLALSC
jgi:hypothetical protein